MMKEIKKMENKEIVKEIRLSEVRSEEAPEGKMILEGYALVFNEETLIGDEERGFIEVIDKDALKDTNMKDVPLKYNHLDSLLILARTRNKSLTLSVDERGLKVHAELIDTTTNKDIYQAVRSGLLDKMSFAFTVKSQSWDKGGSVPKRTITGIDRLYDVSIVDFPAYDQTSIHARSLDFMDMELRAMELAESNEKAKLAKQRIKIKTNY